jgi:hypothetical protein
MTVLKEKPKIKGTEMTQEVPELPPLPELDATIVREYFDYDASTGVLTWRIQVGRSKVGAATGCLGKRGYLEVGFRGRLWKAHRLAWLHHYGHWPTMTIDHINGIKTDNRISNLRDVDARTNQQNKRVAHSNNRSSGLLGVSWSEQTKKWVASIKVSRKTRNLGHFSTAEAAHAAYVAAKRLLHAGCTL